jgi:hypothetical protein
MDLSICKKSAAFPLIYLQSNLTETPSIRNLIYSFKNHKLPNPFSGMDNNRDPFSPQRFGKICIFVEQSAEFTAVRCAVE